MMHYNTKSRPNCQLTRAAGRRVSFLTGLSLVDATSGRSHTLCERFHVHFRPLGPEQIARYRARISGPLLDRIDIHIEVPRVEYDKLSDRRTSEPSTNIQKRVEASTHRPLARDPEKWSEAGHTTTKPQRDAIKKRMVDPDDPLKIVVVCDMWLTGTDIPCLHTLYVDKPMRGHGLMQAIARVNRVFKDKPGGLVVDYLGLADELRQALATYTESGGTGKTALDQAEAVALAVAGSEANDRHLAGKCLRQRRRAEPAPQARPQAHRRELRLHAFGVLERHQTVGFAPQQIHRHGIRPHLRVAEQELLHVAGGGHAPDGAVLRLAHHVGPAFPLVEHVQRSQPHLGSVQVVPRQLVEQLRAAGVVQHRQLHFGYRHRR